MNILEMREIYKAFPGVVALNHVTLELEKGEIMAVQHKTLPIYGVQFHPESIMTPQGKEMIRNFVTI